MRWRCVAGLTVGGTFLGEDLDRRRYWVLGGQAGAWTVHVEAPDGLRWGCYHGRAARKLLAWLEAGGVPPPEQGLVAALKAAPLPPWDKEEPGNEGSEGGAGKGCPPPTLALIVRNSASTVPAVPVCLLWSLSALLAIEV